ncbi:putative aldouronate transport system substrate-binding protein [Paenibacillus phyllosphaerae]|uniref:Putative aldouronate transport system substrate-binding protein n=1 Tax=Paenibacillus phyllosphaerae TaxID=274593 RepID=A0A7W5AZM7_9BACL|nr:extracellular solute-binding protein [Paenibacillus phyllosphaerae]MBB3111723.1 putative aldouronate transport system substrate-binding protein [Paenibacillus phyllosphaerae]
MNRNWMTCAALLVVVAVLLNSCAESPANSPEQGTLSEAPVPIHVFALQDARQNLETSSFTLDLEQKYNVKFQWETYPYEGAKEKRQISIASGNYPDTYMLTAYIDQFSKSDVMRYGKQGIFLPLNELIDDYAPHIKAAFEQNETLRALNTAPDGRIYGLVSYSDCFHCSYPNKMWLNTDWLAKLGLEMPTTTEAFKQVLKAFKTQDPNGNGLRDEIPLSGSTEDFGVRIMPFLMNGFIYDDDRNYMRLSGGKVESVATTQQWREGLAYIRSLYEEGLIDPGAFTQSADAFRRLGDNSGDEILGAGAAMHPDIFVSGDNGSGRSRHYNTVPPLTGPYASYAVHNEGGIVPGAKFVITNKASREAQIALIRMVDYTYTTEGQIHAESGTEGIGWRKPEPGERALGEGTAPQVAFLSPEAGEAPNNTGWIGTGHFYMPRSYRESWVQGDDIYAPNGYERRLQEATRLYAGHEPKEIFPYWMIWVDEQASPEASVLATNLKSYIDQSALQFITGQRSLDTGWERYVEELEQMGLSKYVGIMQKGYDAYMEQQGK